MANPNIVNVANIYGKTSYQSSLTTSNQVLVTNNPNSNKIFKINTIIFCNRGAGASNQIYCDLTQHTGGSTLSTLVHGVNLPPRTNFVLTSKSAMIYLPEDRDLRVRVGSTSSAVDVVCSYEEIS
tara:strand:- start:8281 stop:8655 length:375 start_codon:yes stop_codon:yes gene_type:complete